MTAPLMLFRRSALIVLMHAALSCVSTTGEQDGSQDPDGTVPDGEEHPLDGETADIPDTADPGDPLADPEVAPDLPVGDLRADDAAETVCPEVPAPDPVSLSPLPGESPPGRFESTAVDGFTDEYLYNNTDYLKIGVRREWGGSVIFFGMAGGSGPGMNATNAIDANDTGREVQVAFYDPDRIMQNCAWNASCATTPTSCPNSITFLGWDPVQGGNRCNNGSGVEGVTTAAGVLAVTTVPLFWNPNWDRADCVSDACGDPSLSSRPSDVRVIQSMRFIRTHVVEIEYTVINLSDMEHRPTAQEMPTVYTANGRGGPDLWKLIDSEGTQIPIDTPAGGDGFYYENFTTPGGWAAMQNDASDYGVGLYTENRNTSWQGWQLRSLPFNNFRPISTFGIPARGTVKARVYLVLGSFTTISGEAQLLDAQLPPFGVLDGPAEDEVLSGAVGVQGWALDNKGVESVTLVVDGAGTVPLTYGGSRPDVCAVWPGYAGCDLVGFSGTLDTSTLAPCGHILEVRAADGDGNERVIARRRIFVTM